MDPYLVTGLKESGVQPRLEIRDLQKKTEQFTLFIHALVAIMQPQHRPKASRFLDIGGIHGLPYERWIGDPAAKDTLPVGTWGGYCNHGSVLFPVWHRPYLLAIEQSIGETAVRLAHRWTINIDNEEEKDRWINAAKELRFPFWDWTDPSTGTDGLPDVLKPQTFTFTLPGGAQSDPIDNPLAFYDFGKNIPDGFQDLTWNTPLAPTDALSFFKEWRRTYRWPSSKLGPIEDYVKIDEILKGTEKQRGSWEQLREQVAKLFTYPSEAAEGQGSFIWDEFSNTTFQSKDKTNWPSQGIGSIESPHNSVHLVIGGLGDMANNDYAGFDPIFYLHHCNVDRILAFWEYVYNQYWMGNGFIDKDNNLVPFTQVDGTWDEDDNAPIDESSALEPFRTADKAYWDGTQTRFLNKDQTVAKYYTYPDIGGVSVTNPPPKDTKDREKYMKVLQEYFGKRTLPNLGLSELPKIVHQRPGYVPIEGYRRFSVDLQLVDHAFNGSYYLQLLYEDKVISSFAVLSRGDHTKCAACQLRTKAGGHVKGTIDIPDDVILDIIKENGHQGGSFNDVIPSIKRSLTVRLAGPTGHPLADAVAPAHATISSFEDHPRQATLDPRITPTLVLRSASVYVPQQETDKTPALDGPHQLTHPQIHGNLLTKNHNWKTA